MKEVLLTSFVRDQADNPESKIEQEWNEVESLSDYTILASKKFAELEITIANGLSQPRDITINEFETAKRDALEEMHNRSLLLIRCFNLK